MMLKLIQSVFVLYNYITFCKNYQLIKTYNQCVVNVAFSSIFFKADVKLQSDEWDA